MPWWLQAEGWPPQQTLVTLAVKLVACCWQSAANGNTCCKMCFPQTDENGMFNG